MKIRQKQLSYESVLALPSAPHKNPLRPNLFFRLLMRIAAIPDLHSANFRKIDGDRPLSAAGDGPFLILMNHSSFIDLEIIAKVFSGFPFGIVTTTDAFVGKSFLMRQLGCIPTDKFVSDPLLLQDMRYLLKEKNTSVLMFPEAGYSLDGRATTLPRKMGLLLKMLDVPVIFVKTEGAFTREPLFAGLKKRKVDVCATVSCLLTREELAERTVAQLDAILSDAFSYDHFRWQRETRVATREPFRAQGLERLLYKCPACLSEGNMEGNGTHILCHRCGKTYEMDPYGVLSAEDGNTVTEFSHIPDWFDWQRRCVREELENDTYRMETAVDIGMLVDHKALYRIGEGRLQHDKNGFLLTGCDGKLEHRQKPLASHSLNADYFWYEIGDVIAIGEKGRLYYCFPKGEDCSVTKARLAAEELYKLRRGGRKAAAAEKA